MSARNPDGRFRNHNTPIVLSADMLRSRWLEGEVLRLKRLGSATKRSRCRSPRSVAGRGPPSLRYQKMLPSHRTTRSPLWVVMRL
jgi:hypothetical protein